MLDEWVKAKRQGNFALADQLRAEMQSQGVYPEQVRPLQRQTHEDASIDEKREEWLRAKRQRNYAVADQLRAEMEAQGFYPDQNRRLDSTTQTVPAFLANPALNKFDGGGKGGFGSSAPRMSERQLNSLFPNNPIEELEKLFMEFVAWPDFINDMHMGNLWHKIGRQLVDRVTQDRSYDRPAWWASRDRFRQSIVAYTRDHCHKYSARTLGNIMHGVANSALRDRDTEDMLALCAHNMKDKLQDCNNQNMCNSVWGLATYGSDEKVPQAKGIFERDEVRAFFNAIDAAYPTQLAATQPHVGQDVATSVWSFARAGFVPRNIFSTLDGTGFEPASTESRRREICRQVARRLSS